MVQALLVSTALVALVVLTPQAHAQELTVAAGATRIENPADTTYAWLVSYSHELAPQFSAAFSYRNEGHVPSHHRDGHALQFFFSSNDGPGFGVRAGLGPYRYFDTTLAENPAGFANAHGWGAVYTLAATWRDRDSRWTWELRADRIEARDSFNTTQLMFGASYRLNQDGSLRTNAPPRRFGPRESEVALMWGRTIVNSFESESARARNAEFRHTFAPAVRASVGWLNEGDARLIRRNGVVAQLWLEPSFGDDRFTIGLGVGPYFAIDGYTGPGSRVQAVIGTTFSYHFAHGWSARVTWNRVASNYDRDSDIILAGLGYRF